MEKIAIIGGSGLYNFDGVETVQEHIIETPYGNPSGSIIEGKVEGNTFFFLPRHGQGHTISPSEINYRANIYALKLLGADTIISISAVGSLKEEYPPGHFVLPSQFIDWTKGFRERSFFGDGVVGHVSNAYPVNKDLQGVVFDCLKTLSINSSQGGSYICIEGPQFSTRAESEMYRSFGADVIGMTNVPEVFLAKEAGMSYATVAMVTDYDCWKEEHCTVEQIIKVMTANTEKAHKLIKSLIPALYAKNLAVEKENTYAIITKEENIPDNKQEILKVLLK